jgi:hypothetical protein
VEQAARLLAGVGRSCVRLRVALERARHAAPQRAAALASDVEAHARQQQQVAIAGQALELQVEALRRCGDSPGAAATARRLLDHLLRHGLVAYPPLPWWVASQALEGPDPKPPGSRACGLVAAAGDAAARAGRLPRELRGAQSCQYCPVAPHAGRSWLPKPQQGLCQCALGAYTTATMATT